MSTRHYPSGWDMDYTPVWGNPYSTTVSYFGMLMMQAHGIDSASTLFDEPHRPCSQNWVARINLVKSKGFFEQTGM
jgi:hypothetical protein